MGLRPWEFWRLTPYEYNVLADEYRRDQRRKLEREAHWIAVLLNGTGRMKKTVKMQDLIGWSPEQVAQIKKEMDEKRRRYKKQKEEQNKVKA